MGRQSVGRWGRRGVVAAWVALTMVALVAIAALTLDVGQVLVARVQLQKACDGGALAACDTDGDPIADAATFYAHNAFPDLSVSPSLQSASQPSWTYGVSGDVLVITNPYSDAYTQAASYNPTHLYGLRATRTVPACFGALLGSPARTVNAMAVGWRYHVSSGTPAIFAHNLADDGIKWAGGGGDIEGDVVANWSISFSGSSHVVHGSVYYGQSYTDNGSGSDADGYFKLDHPRDWPTFPGSTDPSDLGPYTYYINGNYSPSGGTIPPGVYYVTGDVKISGSCSGGDGVTFIAGGTIGVSGSNQHFTAAAGGVLFYSLSTDGDKAIHITGSGSHFGGTCFAPYGAIRYDGSALQVMEGALIADAVTVTGTGFTIRPTGQASASEVKSKLVE